MNGCDLPEIVVTPPGPESRRLSAELRQVESRNVTFVGPDSPIFLKSGAGANLQDVDGNTYVDLCAAFAVAAVGHSNPRVISAIANQAARLLHGMGDVYPTEEKVVLAHELCALAPGRFEKRVYFGVTGADAVEAALKTAMMATGKPGVICFEGAYHGLSYGALEVTDRDHFRAPFARQLGGFSRRLPYPDDSTWLESIAAIELILGDRTSPGIGAVLVEPIQGRGGDRPAPLGWLRAVRELCRTDGPLLVLDEVYSGFGRTGRWFACEHAGIAADLLCVGKGMASGFPISACIGRADVMDSWPPSTGEAIHTSTFLGSPTGCAAALASITELRDRKLVERAASFGVLIEELLRELRREAPDKVKAVRGRGMMWGIQCANAEIASRAAVEALRHGVLVLTSGVLSDVIALSPPLVITEEQLRHAIGVLSSSLK
ncbi:MAG TPA: aspartate aminotransferase family protein [Candidatus Eremiobacteraceae bacterium]